MKNNLCMKWKCVSVGNARMRGCNFNVLYCNGLSVFCRTNRRTFSTSKPLLCTGLLVLHAVYPGQLKITWRQLKSKFYFPFIQVTLHSERGRFIAKKAENKQKRHTPGKRKGHFLVPVKRPRPKLGCWLIHRVIFVPGACYHLMTHLNAKYILIKKELQFIITKIW